MKKLSLVNRMFKLSQCDSNDVVVLNKQTDRYDPIVSVSKRKVYRETYLEYLDKLIKETQLDSANRGNPISSSHAKLLLSNDNPNWSDKRVYEEICKFEIYDDYVEALYRDMPDFKDRYIVKDVLVIETVQSSGNHF